MLIICHPIIFVNIYGILLRKEYLLKLSFTDRKELNVKNICEITF